MDPSVLSDQERRDLKNTERRAARHQAALNDPRKAVEQRKESGRARCDVVAEVWKEIFSQLVERESNVQRAAAMALFDLELVQAVVEAHCVAEHHSPIPATAPVWETIPPRTMCMLAAVARAPMTFDVRPFLANGALILSKRGDPPLIRTCANYVRRIAVPSKKAAESLSKYLCAYPADAPNSVLQLLLLGQGFETTRPIFRAAMEEYGLEQAVDIFLEAAEQDPAALALLGSRKATSETCFPYNGMTASVACADRGWDDADRKGPVRILNFLSTNEELEWNTFHIPDLDTLIESDSDVHTRPEISHKERIGRAILGTSSLNSAPGGVQPLFVPSAQLLALRENVRNSYSPVPTPLGNDLNPVLEAQLKALIEDEVCLIGPMHVVQIAGFALNAVKAKVASVLRLSKGRVVTIEITRDIPLEAMLAHCGGYWDSNVGPRPQEDRYMRQLFHPEIPTTGDLSLDIIAQFIGPYVDFWRVTVGHTLYWIHVLLLSRLLFYLNPLIMTSQSNLVAAMIESGDLVTAWTMIPVSDAEEFVTGNSPPHLNQYFPDNVNYRNFRAGEFNARLGSISLVRTGRDKSRISLHIPAGDAGRYKYDPTMAYRRWVVDFLVRIVSETVIHVSTRRLHEEAEIDWNEPEEVYQWLTVVKATAQEKLVQAGITTVLEVSKNAARRVEFVLTFLRSLQSSKRAHERWLENGVRAAQPRREGTLTVGKPFSGDRRQQVLDIVKDAQDLDLYDLPPDPNHFGSFPHPILSQSFMLWLLALAEGTGIVYASNALGRTQAGYKAAQARNQKFGEWRHSSGVDISAIERRDLVQSVKETAGAAAYLCDELHRSARYAHCRRCDSFVIARHNDSKHRCSADNNQPKQVTATEFPDIERVLYPHDLLNNPLMLAALGDRNDILAEVGLVAFAAQSILDSGQLILSKVLPVKDFSAFSALPACNSYIYIPETQINNKDLLLTLAVDVVLKSNSTCPEHFLPVDPQYRLAWRQNQSTLLMSWFSKGFSGGTRNMYLISCHGAPGTTMLPHFFLSDKVKERVQNDGFRVIGGRECNVCNKSTTCSYRKYFKVTSILDLPPHYARHIWFCLRRGVQWPKMRPSRSAKSKRLE